MEVIILAAVVIVLLIIIVALFVSGEIVSSRGIRKTFKDDDDNPR